MRRYEKFNRPDVFFILKLRLGSSFRTKETLVSFLLIKEIFRTTNSYMLLYIHYTQLGCFKFPKN